AEPGTAPSVAWWMAMARSGVSRPAALAREIVAWFTPQAIASCSWVRLRAIARATAARTDRASKGGRLSMPPIYTLSIPCQYQTHDKNALLSLQKVLNAAACDSAVTASACHDQPERPHEDRTEDPPPAGGITAEPGRPRPPGGRFAGDDRQDRGRAYGALALPA